MATDATGAPTALGIPKYNTSVDAPSGQGFNAAMDAIDSIITAKTLPTAGGANRVPVWNGSSWVAQQLDNNQIAAGAGILGSKLNWSEGAAPPGSPAEGDIWVMHPEAGSSWMFRYDPTENGTYPWQFVGGPPWHIRDDGNLLISSGSYVNANNVSQTLARAGAYYVRWGGEIEAGSEAPVFEFWLSVSGFTSLPSDTVAFHTAKAQSTQWDIHGAYEANLTASAGAVARLQGRVNSGSFNVAHSFVSIVPLRVA
jgi:hypothetical protein